MYITLLLPRANERANEQLRKGGERIDDDLGLETCTQRSERRTKRKWKWEQVRVRVSDWTPCGYFYGKSNNRNSVSVCALPSSINWRVLVSGSINAPSPTKNHVNKVHVVLSSSHFTKKRTKGRQRSASYLVKVVVVGQQRPCVFVEYFSSPKSLKGSCERLAGREAFVFVFVWG